MKKILLILGASSDVGTAFIKSYADKYDVIIGTYNSNKTALDELAEQFGEKIVPYKLNCLSETDIDGFAEYLAGKDLMPNYVLFLPARQEPMVRANELDSADLRNSLEVSAVSFMRVMKTVLPAMCEQNFGRICVMLSSVTKNAVAFQSAYMISKYALLGAVKALAAEYASKHITVNAVSPSMIDTKFVSDTTGLVKKNKFSIQPLKRLAEPSDVNRAMEFFLENDNEYINGENLLIAGGGIIS